MKIKNKYLLTFCMLALLITTFIVPAQAGYDYIDIVIRGDYLFTDVPPVMYENRVFVPMRAIFEASGVSVQWNPHLGEITATDGQNVLIMYMGAYDAYINGEIIYLDVPPVVIYGRTMVPIRFIGETLGYHVQWDDYTQTVYLD
ncbi:hypothetical protein JCM14036_10710 [Desulfotomaculum defluvii]